MRLVCDGRQPESYRTAVQSLWPVAVRSW
jgi:hypothetical protein